MKALPEFPPLHRRSEHDWDQLLDGTIWQLERGVDFDCAPESFRTQAHTRASARAMRVRTRVEGDHVTIQAFTPPSK